MKGRLKDILSRPPERMAKSVKWFFTLPLAYITYLVGMLFIPKTANILLNSALRYILLIFSLLFVAKLFKFNWPTLFCFSGKFKTKTFFIALITMFTTGCASTLIWLIIQPNNFSYALNTTNLITTWIGTALYIAIAALFEELYFRSYIINFRDVEANSEFSVKDYLLFCIISGIVFIFAHFGNPEIKADFIISSIFYFIMGASFMFISLKTKGIEAALGMHIANNLVSGLICSYDSTVLITNTVFINHSALSPILIIQTIFCLAITIFVISKVKK